MQLLHLLFDFRGRIRRRPFNYASLGVMVFAGLFSTVDATANPLAALGLHLSPRDIVGWWATLALLAKRYHDLGMSGWWSLLPAGAMALAAATGVVGFLGGTRPEIAGPAMMMAAVAVALMGWALWHAFMLCSATGDEGANAFGPAPETVVPAAASNREPVDATPDWAERALAAAAAGPVPAPAGQSPVTAARPSRAGHVATPTFGRRAAAR